MRRSTVAVVVVAAVAGATFVMGRGAVASGAVAAARRALPAAVGSAGAPSAATALAGASARPAPTVAAVPATTVGSAPVGAALDPGGSTGAAPGPGATRLRGVVYGHDDGAALRLDADLVRPADHQPVPAVVLLHGGGWSGGSRSSLDAETAAVAAAGMDAFDVDYRLATAAAPGFPSQLADVQTAVAWIDAHAASLGVDPGRIGALGVSAGANLALLAGMEPGPGGSAPVFKAVVSWSAPTDLGPLSSLALQQCPDGACGQQSLAGIWYWPLSDYLGCRPGTCPTQAAAASPVDQVNPAGAALMVWNSTDELVPLAQADELTAAATAVGEPVSEQVVTGTGHGTDYADQALAPSLDFLASQLGG